MSMLFLIILVALMIPLIAVILDSQLGRALAGRLERGALRGEREDDSLSPRVAALEAELDRLTQQVQRLEEESEFLHRLLAAKESPQALPPGEQTG
ncbi:MAG TPA: hypothetical protein VFQ38_16825 [Longimicrobiales bacterium]|nr:hypothetical protein [Longimicrobiales bacterium]